MRLTLLFVIGFFLVTCTMVQAYYLVTPDKTFFIGNTTYYFNQTINVTTLGKDGFWFIVDDLYMMALTVNNTALTIRINSFNSSMVNFTYHANKTCEIFFNCSGLFFTKIYLGGNETLQVSLPANVSSAPYENDPLSDFLKSSNDNSLSGQIMRILPLILILVIPLFLLLTLRGL